MVTMTVAMLNFRLFGSDARHRVVYGQVRTKDENSIPESGKGRRPQPLKQVVVSPGILSLENHSATLISLSEH
jgi:hypothetical protein